MSNKKLSFKSKQRLSQRWRIVVAASLILLIVSSTTFLIVNLGSTHQGKAAVGMHGAKTVTTANTILNEYTSLTSDASAGNTTVSVSSSSLNANSRFSGSLSAGELVMIIQMQGATISTSNNSSYGSVSSYNNCGNFEFAEVASVPNGTTINLSFGLKNSYSSSCNVQVIRVPRYSSLTINSSASVTCPAWNGSTGGIVAIESNGTSVINGNIDASEKGFRGGTVEQNTNTPGDHSSYRSSSANDGAEKGESIAGLASSLSNGRYGRGAAANGGGGGNSHNAGGGGGANAGSATWNGGGIPDNPNSNWTTAWNLEGGSFSSNNSSGGGRGGYSWSSVALDPITTAPGNSGWTGDNRHIVGGLGGRVLDYSTGRIFFGGGGGAGDSNNGVGTPGGNGGGIVFLLSAGTVSGTGSIIANGGSVATSSGTPGDAGGGAGGGGTIIIYTTGASVTNITLSANGGTGGSQNLNNGGELEGPGGGGGGGYISTTNAVSLSRNVNGGMNGTTNVPHMANFIANGATKGAAGIITTLPANPYSGSVPLPIELTSFNARQKKNTVEIKWTTSSEKDNDYFTLERSDDAVTYHELARIPGAGNSSMLREYNYIDENPLVGHNYYRLAQTDYNGRTERFKVILIDYNEFKNKSFGIGSVSPNPFSDKLDVTFSSEEDGTVEIYVMSSEGQVVLKTIFGVSEGDNIFTWYEWDDTPPATYFLYILSGSKKTEAVKIIKR